MLPAGQQPNSKELACIGTHPGACEPKTNPLKSAPQHQLPSLIRSSGSSLTSVERPISAPTATTRRQGMS